MIANKATLDVNKKTYDLPMISTNFRTGKLISDTKGFFL